MKLNKLSKQLLFDLFRSTDGLFIYTLYSRYKRSPKALFLAIKFLTDNGLAISNDERISISATGKEFALSISYGIRDAYNKFDMIPKEFIGPKIKINEFYIPKIKK